MTAYTWAWVWWLAMFGVIEGHALLTRNYEGSLSEHVIAWASMRDKSAGWRLRRLALVGFLAWLNLHWLTGGAFF